MKSCRRSDPDIGRIAWGRAVEKSANEILAAQAEADKDGGKVAEACELLAAMLADGEWKSTKDVMSAMDAHGFSRASVKRARAASSIEVEKHGERWCWRLGS